MVDAKTEQHAVQAVEERMRDKFPQIDPTDVKAVVQGVHAELTGPLREYVPVLVEHAARDLLAEIAHPPGGFTANATRAPRRAVP